MGNETSCKFCEALKENKQIIDFKNNNPKYYNGEKWNVEYTVALVIRKWLKGRHKSTAGRATDYRYRGIGYKLNYCPECGRKL